MVNQPTPPEALQVYRDFGISLKRSGPKQLRSAATHRGGDNKNAFCVDVENGRWRDFVLGEGGDVIDFVRAVSGRSFIEAVQIVSDLIGRDVLGEKPFRPARRFTRKQIDDANLSQVGYDWHLEELLDALKALAQLTAMAPEVERIAEIHELQQQIGKLRGHKFVHFFLLFRKRSPKAARKAVGQVNDFQTHLGSLMAAGFEKGVAA